MRSRVRTWALAAFLCCRPLDALTQDTRSYELRVDSLAKVSQRAEAALAAYKDTVRRNSRAYDSVVVGPLRVLTDGPSSAMAREAAQAVVTTLTASYGKAVEGLAPHTLLVREEWEGPRRLIFVGGVTKTAEEYPVVVVQPQADLVLRALFMAATKAMISSSDWTLMKWLGTLPPMDSVATATWTGVRMELLSSRATVGRRCYAGDIDACKLALALVPSSDPATEWFNAADRHRVVERYANNAWRPVAGTWECLGGQDSACVAMLRRYPNILPGTPIEGESRITLVQLATTLGGTGSRERLLLTPGTPAQRIAIAAGVSTDSVTRLWLQRARDARVPSDDMSLGIAASSLVWILACGALALRSSRWR